MPLFDSVFTEIAAILMLAAVIGGLALRLRQPLIIGFIAVGILEGPAGFGWVRADDQVDLLAKIGVAVLLFIVGLKLDLRLVRSMGSLALITGAGQMSFTAGLGYAIARGFGIEPVAALYVSVGLAFSSTIIVVKLLSDKREIDSLHGRAAVGILIVQDVAVLLVMIALTTSGAGGEASLLGAVASVLFKAGAVLVGLALLMRFVIPGLLERLAQAQELLVLFGIAWAVALAAGAEAIGFSHEVGAFLAGVSLATSRYREILSARLVTLRDFLLLFFFINLGATLDLDALGAQLGAAAALSLLALLGKPLFVMVLMGGLGFRRRTAFLTGISLAQVSEFSLLLGALGRSLGHVDVETTSLITLIGLSTIALSTYLTLYANPVYQRLAGLLGLFERPVAHPEESADSPSAARRADVILFGLGRYGGEIARGLLARGYSLLGVDFDPALLERRRREGLNVRYGDAQDPEFVAMLPLAGAGAVVSTAHERDVNAALVGALRLHGYGGAIAVCAHDPGDAEALRRAGAEVVLAPFADAAKEAVDLVSARLQGGGVGRDDAGGGARAPG